MELKRWLPIGKVFDKYDHLHLDPALLWTAQLGNWRDDTRLGALGASLKEKNLVPRTHTGQFIMTSPRECNTTFGF